MAVFVRTQTASGGGDVAYVYTQGVAALVWNIAHNLGKFPAVTTVDNAGNQILGAVVYTDANNLTVTFANVLSGKAYLN